MKNDLLVAICTRTKTQEEFAQRPIYKSLNKHYDNNDLDFVLFSNNQRGLSECYNEVLKDEKNSNKTVLFVHDDLELEDLFLAEKLKQSPYTVTGLAGSLSFNKKAEKAAWHLAASPTDFVGEVSHYHPTRGVWTTVFGKTNSRALILDGLFLAVKVNELKEKNVLFDEEFGFHFYDIAFCLRAHENKVKCGVLPINVVHHGLGDSMMSPEWEEANTKFKQKYCI